MSNNSNDRSGKTAKVLAGILVVFVIALAGVAGYLYKELRDSKNSPTASQEAAQKESKRLKEKVGKLAILPDEMPVIGTINDKDKFKDQPFFAKAENGDKILIFSESKKAFIYREKDNIIINSGPIAVTSDSANANTNTKKVTLVGNNSTTKQGLSKISGITVVESTTAPKKEYSKVLVFDVDGNDTELAKQIATELGGEVVSSVPSDESNPTGVDLAVYTTN